MKQTLLVLLASICATAAFAKPATASRRRHVVMLPPYIVAESRHSLADESAAQLAELRQKANTPIGLPSIAAPHVDAATLASSIAAATPANDDASAKHPPETRR